MANNYRNFSTRSFGFSPRPNMGTTLRHANGAVTVGGLSVQASEGAKEMLGNPVSGFFPCMLERLNDGTSKASGNTLGTKTLRAMISREGKCARLTAIGPYTGAEVEKVAVGEQFLALGETIKTKKGSFFLVSQIIPRSEYEKMTVEQQAKATAGAKPVLNAADLERGHQQGAGAE